jgi:hypothetical protein
MVTMTSIIMVGHFLKLNSIFRAFRTLFRAYPDVRGTHDILNNIRKDAKQYEDKNPFTFQPDKGDSDDDAPDYPKSWDSVPPQAFTASSRPMTHEWGHRTRETTESFMTASLALYNQVTDPNLSDQRVPAPLIYAPDYICGAIVFAASYSVKMHLMGMLLFKRVPETTEVTRSVIDRLICMFRQASSGSSASPLAEAEGVSPESSTPHSSTPRSNAFATPSIMAARCAHALTALVKTWDARVQQFVSGDAATTKGVDEKPWPSMHADSDTTANNPQRDPTPPGGDSGTPQRESPLPITSASHSAADAGSLLPHSATSHPPASNTTAQYPSASAETPSMEPLADFIASFTGYSQPGHIPSLQADIYGLPLNFDIVPFHDPMFPLDLSNVFDPALQDRWLSW